MTQIITTNLKQQSELFEKKPFYLEYSNLTVLGRDIKAGINKSIIPKTEANKLIKEKDKPNNTDTK
jgi:hypothetical protein